MNSGGVFLLPAAVWGAGAYFALHGLSSQPSAVAGAILAFCTALWLTYLWARGSNPARNVLLTGVVVGLAIVALTIWTWKRA
jgi:hypothetical protein